MKQMITAAALVTAALASGCATYHTDADDAYRTRTGYYTAPAVAPATGVVVNPAVPVAEADNNATPYRQYTMFFKDRGLHQEVPSALVPRVIVGPPVVQPAG